MTQLKVVLFRNPEVRKLKVFEIDRGWAVGIPGNVKVLVFDPTTEKDTEVEVP